MALTHLWSFDEGTGTNAADSAGSANATLQSGASWTTDRNAQANKAVRFDGSGSGRATVTITGLTNVLSFAFFINYRDSGDGVVLGGAASCYAPYIEGPGAAQVVAYADGHVAPVSVAHGGLTSGTWYHIAITRNHLSVKFYKNATQIGTTQTLADDFNHDNMTMFGSYGDNTFPATCDLDDFRIYDHELSQAEISALYSPVTGWGGLLAHKANRLVVPIDM